MNLVFGELFDRDLGRPRAALLEADLDHAASGCRSRPISLKLAEQADPAYRLRTGPFDAAEGGVVSFGGGAANGVDYGEHLVTFSKGIEGGEGEADLRP